MSANTTTKSQERAADETDAAVHALMVQVGERVRQIRERKGIARRVLSEKSGVSPRYLAQLESGEGNISIGLLQRVAIALDHRIEWFVGVDDPWTSDAVRVADMYRSADQETKSLVLNALSPATSKEQRAERICLVGLRGAGKSTLGKGASAILDVPFLELNREIETVGGMPVNEIMGLYGPEGYRQLEAEAIDRIVATHERVILAVAGGIVGEPSTYTNLLARFHTIWVKASPKEHMDRVRAQGDERPMEGNPQAMDQLRNILESREALYKQAQVQLDTAGVSQEASLAHLLTLIRECRFLE